MASRPASTNTHAPALTWVRIASVMPTSGLFAIADQTRIHQISPRRSRNFTRSQSDIGFLVRRSSSRGRSPGAGNPSGELQRPHALWAPDGKRRHDRVELVTVLAV